MGVHGLTRHASIRMQQRGIPPAAVEDLLDFGRVEHDHRGCEIVFFDKAARRRLARERGGRIDENIARLTRAYAVLAGDGAVRTIGWRTKRIWRN